MVALACAAQIKSNRVAKCTKTTLIFVLTCLLVRFFFFPFRPFVSDARFRATLRPMGARPFTRDRGGGGRRGITPGVQRDGGNSDQPAARPVHAPDIGSFAGWLDQGDVEVNPFFFSPAFFFFDLAQLRNNG